MIRLAALDLDGTLLNHAGKISMGNRLAIKEAVSCGTTVVISTGRPYVGLPLDVMEETGIRYAITTNGAAIYEVPEHRCIYENSMDYETVAGLLEELDRLDLYYDVFLDGYGYARNDRKQMVDRLDMTPSLKEYIKTTRSYMDEFPSFLRREKKNVQKITIDFYRNETGVLVDYEAAKQVVRKYSLLNVVSGGYSNLEVTCKEATKGKALTYLAAYLGVSMDETMACGDSENDKDILLTAKLGVVMENAEDCVKQIADAVTSSNEEDGVALAIRRYVLS